MTTKVLPECLLGKLTFPEVLPPFYPSPLLTCTHIHMVFSLVRNLIGPAHCQAPNPNPNLDLSLILTFPLKTKPSNTSLKKCGPATVSSQRYKSTHTHIDTHIPALGEILIKCFIQQSQLLSMKAWLSPESQSAVAWIVGLVRLVVTDTSDACRSADGLSNYTVYKTFTVFAAVTRCWHFFLAHGLEVWKEVMVNLIHMQTGKCYEKNSRIICSSLHTCT